ncbi:MAG TPA: hypothetical protein VGD98_04480 [Ktedonobacteraceae bacterium]
MAREQIGYGSTLRFEREIRGWSQQELITQILALHVVDKQRPTLDLKTIGRWEREECKPSPYYRKLLCQVFGRNAIQLGFITR